MENEIRIMNIKLSVIIILLLLSIPCFVYHEDRIDKLSITQEGILDNSSIEMTARGIILPIRDSLYERLDSKLDKSEFIALKPRIDTINIRIYDIWIGNNKLK